MATERANDLKAFRDFADAKLSNGGAELTLDEAIALWDIENATDDERAATVDAVEEALAAMRAGDTGVPAREYLAEVRRQAKPSSTTVRAEDFLNRMLETLAATLNREAAEGILAVGVDPEIQARVDYLAEKANEGTLTAEERSEYRNFVEASDLLAIFRLKAKRRLEALG